MQTCAALTYSGGGEWNYSEEIIIKENSDSSLTNYQVPIILNSSNFDFSLAQLEGQDIRFTSGDSQLKHWIEEWNAKKETATIWVKVPSIPAGSSTTITMYYGNPEASDIASGSGTFEFFDSFSGTSAFANWDSFTTGGGEQEVSNGVCKLIVPKFHPEDVSSIKSEDEFSINSMFVVKRSKTTTGEDSRGPVITQGFVDPQKETKNQILSVSELQNETKVSWTLKNDKADVRYYPSDLTDIDETEGDWYTIGVAWYLDDELGRISWYKDGIKDSNMDIVSTEENNYIPITDMKVYISANSYSDTSDNTGYVSIDYAYVRNYVPDEPTVTLRNSIQDVDEEAVVETPVRINITPASGIMTAIRIFNTTDYDENAIVDLKDSGLNTIMVLTNEDDIWNLERFVKTAHDNDMQVYAMIFNDPNSDTNEDNSVYVKSVLEEVIDYNSKSLSAFDGVDIALDPCTDDLDSACALNLLLLEDVRKMAGNGLAIAVDIPAFYTLSDLSGVSENADLIILQTYEQGDSNPDTKSEIIDSVASRMGEIRVSEGKALIGISVNKDFQTDADVQSLLSDIEDYYADDSAFMGTSIAVYEDYEAYASVAAPVEDDSGSSGIPGFTGLSAIAGIVGVIAISLIQKRRSKEE
ncbi:DUF2341 domain-containing protein [Methanolobus sediminis]|uniref:DUF2341 domain-containing protein n=1 Tax=Methanolobus sediminis TaxID=3072978 RepID=A0AA51UN97_9EURY|nr:DUF2341 domain-containing protein [Methanolobus sediminis]WMW26464.1 DUF2341 domain-containing protein [Methanolobus sediminis]